MATVQIYFVGICTHLPSGGTGKHRVVLVCGKDGDITHGIQPHYACRIVGGQTTPLDGVQITVEGSKPGVQYDPSFDTCIPRLAKYAGEPIELDPTVTQGQQAAAYVDIAGGTFYGGITRHGCAVSYVTVTSDAEELTLRTENFVTGEVCYLPLADGAQIQIENLARKQEEHDTDFYLHFRVARKFPDHPHHPTGPEPDCTTVTIPDPDNTVGPGCSNTVYP